MRALRPPALVLLIAAAAALPYARILPVPFYLDDFPGLVEDPSVHALDLSPGSLAPAMAGFPLHRWLPRLTFAVNHALGGLEPAGYHLVSLALHVLAALLVFALGAELLARTDPALEPVRRRRAALLAALLFAVHPLQTMAVTYVVQRMALLAAVFGLAALLAWARARRSDGRRRAAWFLAAGAAAFLAMSSKENAAVLPLLVLAFEAFVVGGLGTRLRRRALPASLAALAVAGVVGGIAYAYRAEFVTELRVSSLPLSDRLLTQPRVVALYLGRFLLPWPGWLHFDDGIEPSRALLHPPTTLAAILLLAALAAGAVRGRHRGPIVSFGLSFFLLALVVEQSVVPLDFVFEHRLYLPMAGLVLAAGWGLEQAGRRLGTEPWPVALPVVLLLALATWSRNEDWRDPVRLHGQDVAAFPALTRPLLDLGAARYERGDLDGAEAALRRLVELDPADAKGWSNLAQIAVARGAPFVGIQLADRAIAADPACVPCAQNRAAAYLAAGFPDQALEAFRATLRLAPRNARARAQVGALLLRRGEVGAAVAELRVAVEGDPGSAEAWAGLADALRLAGRDVEALDAARRAVAIAPDSASARASLGRAQPPSTPPQR